MCKIKVVTVAPKHFLSLGFRAVSQLFFFSIIAGSPFCQTFAEGKGK